MTIVCKWALSLIRYKTLKQAFHPKNHDDISDMLANLFLNLIITIGNTTASEIVDMSAVRSQAYYGFEHHLPYPQILYLPEHLKFQVDDTLSQLLSADFQEFSPDFFDSPREFNFVGCALFHKVISVICYNS